MRRNHGNEHGECQLGVVLKAQSPGAGELAQLVKRLLCKQRTWVQIVRTHTRSQTWWHVLVTTVLGNKARRLEDSQKLISWTPLPNWWVPGSQRDPASKSKVEKNSGRQPVLASDLHMHVHMNAHIYTIHTCTIANIYLAKRSSSLWWLSNNVIFRELASHIWVCIQLWIWWGRSWFDFKQASVLTLLLFRLHLENPTPSPTNVVERKVISFYWRAPAPPQLSQRKGLWHIRREKVNYQKHPGVLISHQSRGNSSELPGGRGNGNGEEWLLRTHSTGTFHGDCSVTVRLHGPRSHSQDGLRSSGFGMYNFHFQKERKCSPWRISLSGREENKKGSMQGNPGICNLPWSQRSLSLPNSVSSTGAHGGF